MSALVITNFSGAASSLFGAALEARAMMEYLIYIGAIMLVTAIVTLWIAATRQPLQHSDQRHRHPRSSRRWFSGWFGKSDAGGPSGKKRRRRRSHRKRNPTLAETGGLPPIRNESSSAAEHSPP
jgi:hypothetical protein